MDKTLEMIVNESVTAVAERAVRSVIVHHAGYGITDDIKKAILDEAARIAATPEMQEMIRKQMIHWLRA